MNLLRELLLVKSTSGNEKPMRDFLINYFQSNPFLFPSQPDLIYGDDFQNCLIVTSGRPRIAVFAHIDTTGFMAQYGDRLICIGAPEPVNQDILVGQDSHGPIECEIHIDKHGLFKYYFERPIDPGTELVYKPSFYENDEFVEAPYFDNRIGILNAVTIAQNLTDYVLVFSCWEENHGGTVGYLTRYIYEKFGILRTLISDITWISEGVKHGCGAVVSLRDVGIPRREYIENILRLTRQTEIPFQIEVEEGGSSDGYEVQRTPYPIDWCFIGAACDNMHSSREKIYKRDIEAMHALYIHLCQTL